MNLLDKQGAFDGLFARLLAFELIPAIRNKAEIIYSSKNYLHYCSC